MMLIDGQEIRDRGIAGELLLRRAERMRGTSKDCLAGHIAGFQVFVADNFMQGPEIVLKGATTYTAKITDTAHGTIRSVEYALQHLEEVAANLDRSIADTLLMKYLSYDCLLIDEIGYIEVEPIQVGIFFTLMQRRHKKKPTLITSNLGFSDWGSFLKNPHLTAALVDRLTENSHVFNMKQCVTLRPKLTPEA